MKKLALALLLVLLATPAFAGDAALEPKKTFAFVASITKWPEASGLAEFTDERKDGAFVAALEAAGVPAENVTFLKDEKATLAAMRRELRALATRAGEGSTFIFCFQGHGLTHEGKAYFACYDVTDDAPHTAFGVAEIAPILDECWKGDRAILLGDCCHSGALETVVEHFEKTRVKAACFASATASNRSTGHWTFTESLIEAFLGDGRLDHDHDGRITYAETDRWIHEQMKYREGQLSRATRTTSFEPTFALRPVVTPVPAIPGPFEAGDFVDVKDGEAWRLAQVEAFTNARYKVRFVETDEGPGQKAGAKGERLVPASSLRAPVSPQLEIGARYEVEFDDGEWFPGTVTKCEESWFFFVHYEGENGEDDEWVVAASARKPTPPEFVARAPRAAKKGDLVAARWRQQWFLATVEAVNPKAIKVHYDDGSSALVTKDELIVVAAPGELAEGDRVLACWNGEMQMYPATLIKKGEKTCTVRWEDGSELSEVETAKIARVRK